MNPLPNFGDGDDSVDNFLFLLLPLLLLLLLFIIIIIIVIIEFLTSQL